MTIRLEIAGHMGRISIQVLSYENPMAENLSDANWLRCEVEVQAPPFSGVFSASFTTHDFTRFLEELRQILPRLGGTASFITDEDALRLAITLDERSGRANVSGIAKGVHTGAALSFRFDSDQSFLAQACRELEAIVKEFPIKK